jgi:hypothetical protein
VDYALRGSPRVTWELRDDFIDPEIYNYLLQANPNRDETDEWVDVGTEFTDQFYALDDTDRQFGKSLRVSYRIRVRTVVDTYFSEPAQVLGNLSKRQWLQARALIRRLNLDAKSLPKMQGYMLKRKLHGTTCPDCIDPITGGILNSDCATCLGTGKTTGYWQATENTMFDVSPEAEDTKRSQAGTVNNAPTVRGRFTGIPLPRRNDVWVDANSDRRYFFQSIQPAAEMNRVPIIVDAELRLAEFSDVVYDVPVTASS